MSGGWGAYSRRLTRALVVLRLVHFEVRVLGLVAHHGLALYPQCRKLELLGLVALVHGLDAAILRR